MNIDKSIRELRKKRNLTQGKLAELLGVSQTYLSQVEKGKKKNPSFSLLAKMSDILMVPIPILFWYTLDETDVDDDKKFMYRELKPVIDKMIDQIFDM